MSKIKQEIELAHYFCDNVGLTKQGGKQLTQRQFIIQVNIAKNLLKKYTLEDLKKVIDYLVKNPPRKGLYSIKFLEFVADEILDIIILREKAKEVRKKITVEFNNTTDLSNVQKYNRIKNRKKMKGMGDF